MLHSLQISSSLLKIYLNVSKEKFNNVSSKIKYIYYQLDYIPINKVLQSYVPKFVVTKYVEMIYNHLKSNKISQNLNMIDLFELGL